MIIPFTFNNTNRIQFLSAHYLTNDVQDLARVNVQQPTSRDDAFFQVRGKSRKPETDQADLVRHQKANYSPIHDA